MTAGTRRNLVALAVLATGAIIAGCGGHGQSSPLTPPVSESAGMQGLQWNAQAVDGAKYIGPYASGSLNVNVLVRPQNESGLLQYAQDVSNPASPSYRDYLAPEQIADRFGASEQSYDAAARYFANEGLSVAGWPQRIGLVVAGSVNEMQKAFGTSFGVYQKDGQQFVAPIGTPHVAAGLQVEAVQGIETLHLRHRNFIVSPARAGENITLGYSPGVLQAAFDYNGAYSEGITGTGITVAVIGTGPIESSDYPAFAAAYGVSHMAPVVLATVDPSGVAAGLEAAGIPTATPAPPDDPSPNPNELPDSGNFASPPPTTTSCQSSQPSCNPEDAEAQLDTEQIASLAWGANVLFYLAYNTSDCTNVSFPNSCPTSGSNAGSPQIGIVEADAEVDQAIADDKADVVSISYGTGEPQQIGAQPGQYEALQYAELASEGIAVFVASGDDGSANCLGGSGAPENMQCATYPASDPNVTAVGGVTAPLNSYGQLDAPMVGWGSSTGQGQYASGGGPSFVFAAPAWQSALGMTKRETPDVSMVGDPNTGVGIFTQSEFPNAQPMASGNIPGYGASSIGGTSAAAPEMAAMWALVLQACKQMPSCDTGSGPNPYRLGNAAPYFYGIYGQSSNGAPAPKALPYNQVFDDIVYGNNEMEYSSTQLIPGFSAGTGYDEITGIGVPYAGHLIDAVVNPTVSVP